MGPEDPGRTVDARGARGVQIGDGNLQVNVYADRPSARSAYHHQVRAIAPDDLLGRETDLADLASFSTDPDAGDYLWLRAGPWAGKTALMSSFALNPPPAVCVVSFFVTARFAAQNDRDAFTDVVIEQLASMLGEPVPAYLTDATRVSHLWQLLDAAATFCAEHDERLVLLVDGLDEDTGADTHSIAALLPANPVAGMRVIVAGRHDPPIPSDVPTAHPLRDPAIERVLSASPYAQDIRREAERELKRLLRGTPVEQELLGLVAAAGGGLSGRDLEELTGCQAWQVEESLHAVGGRTFARRPSPESSTEVYVLGHEELQSAAVRFLGEARLSEYRQRVHTWAEGYRHWPAGSPGYLLRGYFQMLQASGDLDRMTDCALDSARHKWMLDVSGGDTIALAQIAAAQDGLLERDPTDVRTMAALAVRRDSLVERNRHIPVDLPALWAVLGDPVRAHGLARSIADPVERVKGLANLSMALAEEGSQAGAVEVAREAQAAAGGSASLHRVGDAMASVAKAVARSGNLAEAVAIAHTFPDPGEQSEVVSAVVEAGALAGDVSGAAQVARGMSPSFWRFHAQRATATAAAVNGDIKSGFVVATGLADPRQRSEVLREVARAAAVAGDWSNAMGIAGAIDANEYRVGALAGIAEAAVTAGEPRHAVRCASRAVAVARAMFDRHGRGRALVSAARATAWAGNLHDAAELARTITDPHSRTRALTEVAGVMVRNGEPEQAATLAHEAETAARSISSPDQQAWMMVPVLRTAALAGDHDHVRHLADHAWTLTVTVADNPEWQATIRAELVAAEGNDSSHALSLLDAVADAGERDVVAVEAVDVLLKHGVFERAELLAGTVADPAARARTITLVARAMARAGHIDRAIGLAVDAETTARTHTAPQRARALARAACAVAQAGDLTRAGDLARSAESTAAVIMAPISRAQATATAAEAFAWSGSGRAMELVREAERLADTFGEDTDRERILMSTARAAAQAGDTAHALTAVAAISNRLNRAPVESDVIATMARSGSRKRVRDRVRAIADPYSQLSTAAAVAEAAAKAGHHHNALVLVGDAVAIVRTCDVASWRASTLSTVAKAVALAGRLGPAMKLAREAAAEARAIPDRRDRVRSLARVAQVVALAGEVRDAMSLVQEAGAEIAEVTDPVAVSWELQELAKAVLLTGDVSRAEDLVRELHPRLRGQLWAYAAQHVDSADARPLLARALRLADWQDSRDALAAVDPAVLAEAAEAYLGEL